MHGWDAQQHGEELALGASKTNTTEKGTSFSDLAQSDAQGRFSTSLGLIPAVLSRTCLSASEDESGILIKTRVDRTVDYTCNVHENNQTLLTSEFRRKGWPNVANVLILFGMKSSDWSMSSSIRCEYETLKRTYQPKNNQAQWMRPNSFQWVVKLCILKLEQVLFQSSSSRICMLLIKKGNYQYPLLVSKA